MTADLQGIDDQAVRINEVVLIPVMQLKPNTWNPNVQDPAVFNALVDHIVDVGFSGSVGVRPIPEDEWEGDWRYEIVDGEHRYKAALVLGMPELPCNVYPEWDTDKAQAETVAFNILSGHLDPVKFTSLFNKLAPKYGEDAVKQMMGFADEALFNRTYRKVKDILPPDMQAKLDKSKTEIKSIDDLSVVLHDLFRKYGHTVDQSYIFFRYGGRTHLMVMMDARLKTIVDKLTEQSASTEADINDLLVEALRKGMKVAPDDGRGTTDPVH